MLWCSWLPGSHRVIHKERPPLKGQGCGLSVTSEYRKELTAPLPVPSLEEGLRSKGSHVGCPTRAETISKTGWVPGLNLRAQ